MKTKTKIELVIEKSKDHFWGRVEGKGFMPTGQGETIDDLFQNVKESIEDYTEHERKEDKFWSKVKIFDIEFDVRYDLEAFFKEHNDLNLSSIAKRAGMNPGLLRQYASGVKHPSREQAKKIEDSIHKMANELKEVTIHA